MAAMIAKAGRILYCAEIASCLEIIGDIGLKRGTPQVMEVFATVETP